MFPHSTSSISLGSQSELGASSERGNQVYLAQNQFLCLRHKETITNYAVDELRALCPECVSEIFASPKGQARVNGMVDSFKNVKNNCSRKLKQGVLELTKQLESNELSYLLNPELVIDNGIQQIAECKQQLLKLIDTRFDLIFEEFRALVQENVRRAPSLTKIFENIRKQIFDLESLANNLETGNAIAAISKVCQLDLVEISEKFRKDRIAIVESRDIDPVEIIFHKEGLIQFEKALASLAQVTKIHPQYHISQENNISQTKYQNQITEVSFPVNRRQDPIGIRQIQNNTSTPPQNASNIFVEKTMKKNELYSKIQPNYQQEIHL